jgi:hypothetical protein
MADATIARLMTTPRPLSRALPNSGFCSALTFSGYIHAGSDRLDVAPFLIRFRSFQSIDTLM